MSELLSKLKTDMFVAIKEKDQDIAGIIQLSIASVQNNEIDKGEKLTEEELIETLRKETKKLQDSIDQFSAAGEQTLLAQSKRQKEYLDQYLPSLMSREDVETHIKEVIAQLGVSSKREMGQVMGKAMSDLKGKADGSMVKDVVMSLLD